MRRINIQKDIESRKNMESSLPVAERIETEDEPVIQQPDAESEIREAETDQSPEREQKAKKRGRSAKGDA